jgi:hypothetical protein
MHPYEIVWQFGEKMGLVENKLNWMKKCWFYYVIFCDQIKRFKNIILKTDRFGSSSSNLRFRLESCWIRGYSKQTLEIIVEYPLKNFIWKEKIDVGWQKALNIDVQIKKLPCHWC